MKWLKAPKLKKGETAFEYLWRTGEFKSKSELRRLFKQGAIRRIT